MLSPNASDNWTGLHLANELLVRYLQPPLVLISCLGTGLVLCGLKRTALPAPHRILLYFLLSSNLLALAVTTPRNYASTALHVDILAHVPAQLCRFWYALSIAATYLPAYVQLGLTLERCLAVVRPLEVRRLFTQRSVLCGLLVIIVACSILAGSLTSRVHQGWSEGHPDLRLCHLAPFQALVLSYVNLGLWLVFPLVIMVTCDSLIITGLRQQPALPPCTFVHPFWRRRIKERRLALILVTMSIVYCASISPFTIYETFVSLKSYKEVAVLPLDELRDGHDPMIAGYLHDDTVWIVTLNCTSIPRLTDWLILVFMSADIRKNVLGLFRKSHGASSYKSSAGFELVTLNEVAVNAKKPTEAPNEVEEPQV